MSQSQDIFHVADEFQPVIREIGLDAAAVFDDPRIVVWRRLADRENCTLDETLQTGRRVRFHIKRYPATAGGVAAAEVHGSQALSDRAIPTAPLIAHGRLADRRSFVIFEDLDGYTPADKWVEAGGDFDRLLVATAELAAELHGQGLHHRDLYLCHFMAKVDDRGVDIKLIDTARVSPLVNPLTRRRWIVKDLAQFWFSTTKLPISDEQRERWLAKYAKKRGIGASRLRSAIARKMRAISRHDARLNVREPGRNISIS